MPVPLRLINIRTTEPIRWVVVGACCRPALRWGPDSQETNGVQDRLLKTMMVGTIGLQSRCMTSGAYP